MKFKVGEVAKINNNADEEARGAFVVVVTNDDFVGTKIRFLKPYNRFNTTRSYFCSEKDLDKINDMREEIE